MNMRIFILKILLTTFLLTSCAFLDNKNYHSNDVDKFYLKVNKFKKKYKGMTREEIIYLLGHPIISDSFSNAYHYIFCQLSKKNLCQKVILNIFFKNDKVFYFSIKNLNEL